MRRELHPDRERGTLTATQSATAWNHRPTRRAWWRHLTMTCAGVPGWAIALVGTLYVYVMWLPSWAVVPIVLVLVYCLHRLIVQGVCVRDVLRIAQLLRTCPWRLSHGLPHGTSKRSDQGGDTGWFEFPDPAGGALALPVVFSSRYRTQWWWKRMMRKATPEQRAEIEPLWFCGNPRLAGVIAASGRNSAPRRLHIVRHLPKSEQDKQAVIPPWAPLIRTLEQAQAAVRVPSTPTRPE